MARRVSRPLPAGDSSEEETPAEGKRSSPQPTRTGNASAAEILRLANAVLADVASRFPQYAPPLRRVSIEASAAMSSSGAKTVFDARVGGRPPRARAIRLSLPLFARRENLRSLADVMLHEIAHVIAGRAAAHGAAWRDVCVKIGGSAAVGHRLSCGGGGEGGSAGRAIVKARPARPRVRREAAGASLDWKRASESLISQIIRF
ncbi:hypothetical protein AB1Y20_003058 [Prymnesium parvum]|uniref:SprT-like domain-containing protein n=1 Tax=Prymnesium parvum TaxID=97485 RepID=A0AB34JAD7_PRYPA